MNFIWTLSISIVWINRSDVIFEAAWIFKFGIRWKWTIGPIHIEQETDWALKPLWGKESILSLLKIESWVLGHPACNPITCTNYAWKVRKCNRIQKWTCCYPFYQLFIPNFFYKIWKQKSVIFQVFYETITWRTLAVFTCAVKCYVAFVFSEVMVLKCPCKAVL